MTGRINDMDADEVCLCGHVADEHGGYLGLTKCNVDDCDCFCFDLDEDATEAPSTEGE